MSEYPRVLRLQVYRHRVKADIELEENYSSQVVFTENKAEHKDPYRNVDIEEIRRQSQEIIGESNEILQED